MEILVKTRKTFKSKYNSINKNRLNNKVIKHFTYQIPKRNNYKP